MDTDQAAQILGVENKNVLDFASIACLGGSTTQTLAHDWFRRPEISQPNWLEADPEDREQRQANDRSNDRDRREQ